jgi:hypothetical protein
MRKLNKKLSKIPVAVTSIVVIILGVVFYTRYGKVSVPGVRVIARQPLYGPALSKVMELDKQNHSATFVFVNEVPGVSAMHNKVIMLPPIGDELRINFDEYLHKGHNGPLYIILPESYAGPKEKFVLKAFPGYKGWYGSMISDNFVMYAAK